MDTSRDVLSPAPAAWTPQRMSAPPRGWPFDAPVPPGGYLWWYVDGLSEDGARGLTMIAFVGSVFSPYYSWSGRTDPENHCAVNLALYGAPPRRWAMTERGAGDMARTHETFAVGPSRLAWRGDALHIEVDERCAPAPRRLKGRIVVRPQGFTQTEFALDEEGLHRWRPVAPTAAIEVDMERPELAWSGLAYLDSNAGAEPLEAGFESWTWARGHGRDGASIVYDMRPRRGAARSLALQVTPGGVIEARPLPPLQPLPSTIWGVRRAAHADAGGHCRLLATFEDAPFYARSLVETDLFGERLQAFHESLELDRFRRRWVRALLPFRMPRIAKPRV